MKKLSISFHSVSLLKFVYLPETGDFRITEEPQTYYDHPHHAELLQDMDTDHPDFYDQPTVEGYLLLEQGENALNLEELPAMTIAAYSDVIPEVVEDFKNAGYTPKAWYNTSTRAMTPLGPKQAADYGGYYSDPSYRPEMDYDEEGLDEHGNEEGDYTNVPTLKFVHEPHYDTTMHGPGPQTYYQYPHHSDLQEELSTHIPGFDWDNSDSKSGYYYLGNSSRDAMTYEPVDQDTIVSTLPPHPGIIKDFQDKGLKPKVWRHVEGGWGTNYEDHRIARKLAVMPNFSLIKFVSLADKFLVGENTHHAYLLNAEFGSAKFPVESTAIGRAWLENNEITGVGFDLGSESAQTKAIRDLAEWAKEQGYTISPDIFEEPIRGISAILS